MTTIPTEVVNNEFSVLILYYPTTTEVSSAEIARMTQTPQKTPFYAWNTVSTQHVLAWY